jgi:hypothetical protein
MTLPNDNSFVHRANSDGTTDSICTRCFVTVCTSVWEAKLTLEEKKHVCDPDAVAHWNRDSNSKGIRLMK